jgi:outer membrane protein TolC
MRLPDCRLPFIVAAILCQSAYVPVAAQDAPASLSLTLQDAIELAIGQGRDVQRARATLEAARYNYDSFHAQLFPQLSLTGDLPRYNRSIIEVVQPDGSTLFRSQNETRAEVGLQVSQTIPFTGGTFFATSSVRRLSVGGIDDRLTWSSVPVTLGISQPLFQHNNLGWDRREQPMMAESAERQYREAREDVAVRVTGLFFDVYTARVNLETATSNAAVNDTLYTLNNGRYEIGRIGENDLLQSELALLQAQTALDAAILELERTTAALRIALNIPANTPVELVVPANVPQLAPDTAVAVREALRNQSTMTTLDLQGVQADRLVSQARLSNGFDATVTASYGFNATGNALSDAYQNLLGAQQVRLQVDIPLLQWGAGRSAVSAASARRDEIEYAREATLEQVAHDARFAALQLSQARRGLDLSAKADSVGDARFEVAYNRYVIGRIDINSLFTAQREKDQARQNYVRALRGFWEAYYQLRRVTLYDFERNETIR